MRPLLFDENTSWRIVRLVAEVFPGSVHVSNVGLLGAADTEIYAYAAQHHLCIVAFDRDFYHLALAKGDGVRLVWLRTGNLPTQPLAALLISNQAAIKTFLSDENGICLQLFSPNSSR